MKRKRRIGGRRIREKEVRMRRIVGEEEAKKKVLVDEEEEGENS
jgi:hypothetical protein